MDQEQTIKITAKVGTLKRKQQMRDFLEQLPKDDHDDFFSTTPLKNQRVLVRILNAEIIIFFILTFISFIIHGKYSSLIFSSRIERLHRHD